jgi:hypothetical protein
MKRLLLGVVAMTGLTLQAPKSVEAGWRGRPVIVHRYYAPTYYGPPVPHYVYRPAYVAPTYWYPASLYVPPPVVVGGWW